MGKNIIKRHSVVLRNLVSYGWMHFVLSLITDFYREKNRQVFQTLTKIVRLNLDLQNLFFNLHFCGEFRKFVRKRTGIT
jgi:hypothetical protein